MLKSKKTWVLVIISIGLGLLAHVGASSEEQDVSAETALILPAATPTRAEALKAKVASAAKSKGLDGVLAQLPQLSLKDPQYIQARNIIEKLVDATPGLTDQILDYAMRTLLESSELPKIEGFGELVYTMHELHPEQTYATIRSVIYEIEKREGTGYEQSPVYEALLGMMGQWALDNEKETLDFLLERKNNPAAVKGLWHYLRRVPWSSENARNVRAELDINEEDFASHDVAVHHH